MDEADDASAIAEGLAEIETARMISHETVKTWLSSWGKPNEVLSSKIVD